MAYYHNKRSYKGRGKRRFNMPGSFGGTRAPDVAYSWADWNFSTGEFMFNRTDNTGAGIAPTVNVQPMQLNAGRCFQGGTSPAFFALCVNDPRQPYIVCPSASDGTTSYPNVICQSTGNQLQSAGAMNLQMWAPIHRYCCVYKTKISIEFTPAYIDEGTAATIDDLNNDKLMILYMLPNRQFGDATNDRVASGAANIMNPFTWSNAMTTMGPTTQMLNRNVKKMPLATPNTIGGGTRLKACWSLRNQSERNMNYMLKNMMESNGTVWGPPQDFSGQYGQAPSGASQPAFFFYFGLATNMGSAAFTYKSKFRVWVRFYYKSWQVRDGAPSWVNLVNEALSARAAKSALEPPQDDQEMEVDDDDSHGPYESVPSTPVIEQLTRELAQFGHAQKILPKKKT